MPMHLPRSSSMPRAVPRRRTAGPRLLAALALLAAAAPAHAQEGKSSPAATGLRLTLAQLIAQARQKYPGVEAAQRALEGMEAQLYRAKWAWLPQGQMRGFVAPSPDIKCLDQNGKPSTTNCFSTTSVDARSFNISGILARIELDVGVPLYTFGKLAAARQAAAAGVDLRRELVRATGDDLELKVTRAYFGLKLAREILRTVREGKTHLVKAKEKIEKDLDDGEGDSTVTDLLRIQTFTAEVDARIGEGEKGERIAHAALGMMAGLTGQAFDVDSAVLDPIPGKLDRVGAYLQLARQHRPETHMVAAAVKAARAGAAVEKAGFFPDFVLVAYLGYAVATSADDPQNAFFNDPLNFFGAGFGLAMRWNLDTVQQVGRYRAARALARETEARRAEGLAAIDLEIRREYLELAEAQTRLQATDRGQKAARKWLVATSQNLSAGLAEPKDLTDALLAFFQLRVRYLQAIHDVNVGWAVLGRVVGLAARRIATP